MKRNTKEMFFQRHSNKKNIKKLCITLCYLGNLGVISAEIRAEADLSGSELDKKHIIQERDIITVSAPVNNPLFVVSSLKKSRQPVPASDGADLLKTIPGFSQMRNGGSNGDPIFRGMFGSRLKIMADGVSFPGACSARMDASTAYIMPDSYDILNVIKGPQTVIWGPGASAGTLLFERKPENFSEAGWRGSAGQLFGSNRRQDTYIDTALGNEQGYLRFIGNTSKSQDYKDGNHQRVPSTWNKWNTDVVVGITPTENALFEFTAGKSDGEARYATRRMDGSQFLRESFSGKVQLQSTENYLQKTEIHYYYNHIDHVMDNYSLRSTPESKKMRANVGWEVMGGRLVTHWQWDDIGLQTGLDMQQNTHRKNAKSVGWLDDAKFTDYGAFGELAWQYLDNNKFITGIRVDSARVRDFRVRPSGEKTERNELMTAGFMRYEHQLPAMNTLFYTGLGYTERFPDYWELFSPKRDNSGRDNAFSSIRSEKTTQIDIGVQYKNEQLSSWLSGYIGRIDDFILFSYDGMDTRINRAGNIDARIMGAETGLMWRLHSHWRVDTSLAYSWGENSTEHRALPQMPPLDTRFNVTYLHNDNWSASLLWRIVAKQGRIAPNQGNVVGKDFKQSQGFGVVSLNGIYHISRNIQISTGIDNLLNKAYSEHLNLAGNSGFGYSSHTQILEPGRTLWTKIRINF